MVIESLVTTTLINSSRFLSLPKVKTRHCYRTYSNHINRIPTTFGTPSGTNVRDGAAHGENVGRSVSVWTAGNVPESGDVNGRVRDRGRTGDVTPEGPPPGFGDRVTTTPGSPVRPSFVCPYDEQSPVVTVFP